MSPNLILPAMVIVFILGGLGYSYHLGHNQGTQVCEAEKITAMLEKAKAELVIKEELTKLQEEQIGEAQDKLKLETELNAELKDEIAKLNLNGQSECIPLSVLNELRKFRQKSYGKNS